ncbi:TolC family outer membrane protein [Candidatus Phycosocius spiralis]|uniref:Membrane protein n=1 Tax=Candidatus Phycosocius spiralis TaxID=2815099 RepID=A0ABQ4PXY9_9PROT|nr:TolC family outer membrane protein [Candidatus Phycosocius spiralis]GIU67831.1 membrane protein [Candidatus Phycosocius spiralis]
MIKSVKTILYASWCLIGFSALVCPALAQSLPEAVTMALQTNPGLESQRASLKALGQRRVQAGAQRRLQMSGEAAYTNQESWTRSLLPNGDLSSRLTGENAATTYAITATQPIWLAGRVKAAMNLADAQIAQASARLAAGELEIIAGVVIAYADLARDLSALDIRRHNMATLSQQLLEIQARFEVGDVTKTDVAQIEARLAASKAALALAQANVDASRSAIERLIGQPPTQLRPVVHEVSGPADLEQAIFLARAHNPELAAIRLGESIALSGAKVTETEYRPRLTLQASSARALDSGFEGNRSGNTTITARLTIPLFTGGLASSQITEALGNANAARLSAINGERLIVERTSNAWHEVQVAREAVSATAEQVKAAQIAFDGAQLEQSVGLRTTLDVLIQQQELLEAQLAQARATRDLHAATIGLAALTGVLKPSDLEAEGVKVKQASMPWVTPPELPLVALDQVLSLIPMPSRVSAKVAAKPTQ